MGATDIYIRRPNRTNYSQDNIETNDKLEMFLQEIEMVLGTPPTTVLGRSANGWTSWKTKEGVSLDERFRKESV